MKVLVDTCLWSLALRRSKEVINADAEEFKELIRLFRVVIIGPIRQEILSGVSSKKQFSTLKNQLAAFTDLQLTQVDYERAAEIYNINRSNGIQGSNTDFLICAVSERYNIPIFTLDKDFNLYQKHTKIQLYSSKLGGN